MRVPSIGSRQRSPSIDPLRPSPPGRTPRKPIWNRVTLVAGGLVAGMMGVTAYAAMKVARRKGADGEEILPGGVFKRVQFHSIDGLRISGWFLPAVDASDVVVMCHGFKTGRREMLPLAMALRDRGHHVLMFDFRGHGESEGSWVSCGALEDRDLEGAIRFLQRMPETQGLRIGVVGFSMGAAVAILAAARLPEIAAVVSDSAFATLRQAITNGFCSFTRLPKRPFVELITWLGEKSLGISVDQVRPLDAIIELSPRPVLLIHGTRDRIIPLSEAYLLYEAAGMPRSFGR